MTDRFVRKREVVVVLWVMAVVKVLPARVQIPNAVATPSVQQTMTVFEILPVVVAAATGAAEVAFGANVDAAAAAVAVGLI